MTVERQTWKNRPYKAGLRLLFIDALLYLVALTYLRTHIEQQTALLHLSVWFFLVGSVVSIAALVLLLFGTGLKRSVALLALLGLPVWYGFTIY